MSLLNLKPCMTVSVIGSAGRKSDKSKMTLQLYNTAIEKTMDTIKENVKSTRQIRLVSGGAAWTDHIAVYLFLQKKVSQLLLHFPAKWIAEPTPHFEDNGKCDQHNPGKMANKYHDHFAKVTGIDSLSQIQQALKVGATFKVHNGFHERNKHVALSAKLIAFTWGEGNEPKPGGTLQTWKLCKGQRIHVSYASLLDITVEASKTGQKRKRTGNLDSSLVRPSKVSSTPAAVDTETEDNKYVEEFEGFAIFADIDDYDNC